MIQSAARTGHRSVRVGADVFEALTAACRRAVDEAGGAVSAPNVLAECLTFGDAGVAGRSTPRLASVVPHPRQEWRGARLDVIPSGAAAAEALAALRETSWRVSPSRPVDWDSAVLTALRTALATDVAYIGTAHLAAALLRDPEVRTQDVLSARGTDRPGSDRQTVVREIESSGLLARAVSPWAPAVELLRSHGATADQPLLRRLAQVPTLLRPGHAPIVAALRDEAERHVVRLGHGLVQPLHLVVAGVVLAEQLRFTETALPDRVSRRCTIADRLYAALPPGQNPSTLAADLVQPPALGSAPTPATLESTPTAATPGADGPGWTPAAEAAFDGRSGVRARWLRQVGSDDILAAALSDPMVQKFVQRCRVDLAAIGEISRASR